MIKKRFSKNRLVRLVFGCLFAIISIFGMMALPMSSAYAEPESQTTVETTTETTGDVSCEKSLGAVAWLVCPSTGKMTKAVDWLYDKIEDILVINPVEMKDGTPIYEVWKYARGITNIVFIILLLVVVYSQLTGVGISNYGVKKILPKLIIVAILVNLSFIICSLAVDLSNIIGGGLRGLLTSVEESAMATMQISESDYYMSMSEMYASMAAGTAFSFGAIVIAVETGIIWMLIPVVLGAIVAVASGLITIAMRQAVVVLLIMIAPLAIVAYMLPNVEKWFKKWKDLFIKMLVFYPMFSLLFGASSLAGGAIIASSSDSFGLILGMAVKIFPLFFSWSLMKMSGTFLGTINAKINGLAAAPLAASRMWASSRRELTNQKFLASGNAYAPSLRLRQYLSDRKIAREEEIKEHAETVKNRGLAYAAMKNYKKDGTPTREGEEAYEMQARNMQYQRTVLRHKNNMNKGLGQLEAVRLHSSVAQKARLDKLDVANMNEADYLKIEQARAEKIDYDNAMGFHKRMEDAVNAHFDALNATDAKYKMHDINDRIAAMERYGVASEIMEGNALNIQYGAAYAAQAYDAQAKIIMTKFQKYFELTPPTKDVVTRLREFSRLNIGTDGRIKAVDNIDAIISGLRILNQRGDTDLVKGIIDDVMDARYGGVELGTHASQALASFLMFDVKDNDPFLRRFGKYINLETARAYDNNDRKAMNVTYDEYVRGYHEEPDGTIMYAKKDMRKLVEGTSLDNIERTALSNLDESLKKAYGFDASDKKKAWDVKGWLKKREEIQTAFEPAFLSASLKWLSGSEQMNSGVKFWTGYDLKQQKDSNGRIVVDGQGDPVYDLTPVWESEEFAGHEEEVEKYFRRKTGDYLKDQTTGQVLGMRTDYRDPTAEHLIEMYLNDDSGDESSDERRHKYEAAIAEIQTRYGNEPLDKAKELRAKDLKKLKMDIAGRQFKKIMGETGKLAQIFRTRRSGTAINAKDWLRGWAGLDDEEGLYREVEKYEEKNKEERRQQGGVDFGGGDDDDSMRVFKKSRRAEIRNELDEMWNDHSGEDVTAAEFYEMAIEAIKGWFGDGSSLIQIEFEKFYDRRKDDAGLEAYTLKDELYKLLLDPSKYPDAHS